MIQLNKNLNNKTIEVQAYLTQIKELENTSIVTHDFLKQLSQKVDELYGEITKFD